MTQKQIQNVLIGRVGLNFPGSKCRWKAQISVLGFPEQMKALEMQLETSVHVLRAPTILWLDGLA